MQAIVARGSCFGLQRLRREPVAAALHDGRRRERLSLDELGALQTSRQLDKLLPRLTHAARSACFSATNLKPPANLSIQSFSVGRLSRFTAARTPQSRRLTRS
jgi:hypothetical protein